MSLREYYFYNQEFYFLDYIENVWKIIKYLCHPMYSQCLYNSASTSLLVFDISIPNIAIKYYIMCKTCFLYFDMVRMPEWYTLNISALAWMCLYAF